MGIETAFPKLSRISFKSGPYFDRANSLSIAPGSVVVFVGPNNSGKTQALRDIELACVSKQIGKVVTEVDSQVPEDFQSALRLVNRIQAIPPPGQVLSPGAVFISGTSPSGGQATGVVQLEQLKIQIERKNKIYLRDLFLPKFTLRLDVRSRFELVADREAGDLLTPETNHLQALFRADASRKQVQSLVYDAFGKYLLVDPTGLSIFRLRLGSEPAPSVNFERSLTDEAVKFYREAAHISEFSDGVQAFVGLVTAVYALPHTILLVDEPDAFLHPSLSRKLGERLAEVAETRGGSLVVATHSAEFVLGCIETSQDVTIVRLTFDGKFATATPLPPSEIRQMMRRPLLRSARVIDALFHRSCIVTEGDADRAFYDEINRRLIAAGRGIPDALFISSFGLAQVPKIVSPLRKLGIPSAAIIDLDFITHHQNEWEDLFDAAGIPETNRPTLFDRRNNLIKAFASHNAAVQTLVKSSGLGCLEGDDLAGARLFTSELNKYGIFLVEVGELEGWLGKFEVLRGPSWIVRAFEKLGESEESKGYISPENDDVWEFLDRIASWTRNRLG